MLLALKVTICVFECFDFLEQDVTSFNISDEEKEFENEELELFDKENTDYLITNSDDFVLSLSQKLKSIHYFLDKVCLDRCYSCLTPPPELI